MLTDPAIATAADYADALIVARRAKNALLLIVLLMLLVELALFFVTRYTNAINVDGSITVPAMTLPATTTSTPRVNWSDFAQYATGLAIFLGLLLSVVLSMVLYLLVKIMLVGRLIGVARMTSAFVWSIIVLLLLFPWQSFLANATFSDASFKIPGVLYTWSELSVAKFTGDFSAPSVLHWARFVGFPLLTIVLLLTIQVKSNRGLRQALGEEGVIVDPNHDPLN